MTDIKKTFLFTVQTGLWGFVLGVFVSLLPAQNYGTLPGGYAPAPVPVPVPSVGGDEMTVGQMLAVPDPNVPASPRGQAVPVTKTRMTQVEDPGVSSAVFEAPQNPPLATFPVQQTSVGLPKGTSEEPRPLPEDFPAGEMAPMNPQTLMSFSEVVTLPEGPFQQITIIDPIQKVICVYHINMGNGQIELKSARKIEWDLQLIFLNSKKPLPQDVQAILQQTQKRR